MKKNEMKKNAKPIVSALALALVAITLVFFSGCGGDEDEVSPIVGTWVVSNATANTDAQYPVPLDPSGTPTIEVNAGDDITTLFAGIIANAGPCTDPANTAIQLTEDKKMLYVCIGESTPADETGTWLLSQDEETLTISIVTDITGSTTTIPLNVNPYTVTDTKLTGTISNFAFLPALNQPPIQTISLDVEFTKVN